MATPTLPCFVISLDFELLWGVRDKLSIADYGKNILGVRRAIPAILAMLCSYRARATWATVGLLLFDNKKELLDHLPSNRPRYADRTLDPYLALDQLGENEATDPYHYGLSLARRIIECDGMELGSHTFSHYYCLEPGHDAESFRADLAAAIAAAQRLARRPLSLVFPRNQINPDYFGICRQLGFTSFRGHESHWLYRAGSGQDLGLARRVCRLADAYIDLSGRNGFEPCAIEGLINIPSSRFLRPFDPRLRPLERLRLHRIVAAMKSAAERGESFHMWWHPHNFGTFLAQNLAMLKCILEHFSELRDRYGMQAMTMSEYAERHGPASP
jgi:peptidoglycan/xylan/chitin deacetylase (PgdA/CDA1 family)